MLLHYLKIALRNIRKYKTQTVISVCAMAVSLTLLAIVTSLLCRFQGIPLLNMPYADRVVRVYASDAGKHFTAEDLDVLRSHSFKMVEQIMPGPTWEIFSAKISANVEGSERMKLYSIIRTDSAYLSFMGYKSAVTGDLVQNIKPNEVVINQELAKELFEGRNPIGEYLNIEFNSDYECLNNNYRIIDVKIPSSINDFTDMYRNEACVISDNTTVGNDSDRFVYFLLKEGSNINDFSAEINGLFPTKHMEISKINDLFRKSIKQMTIVRNCIFFFLLLFLFVSFTSFLRQETQLFKIRQREIALRTTIGARPVQLFIMYYVEILIVLFLTLLVSLLLSNIIRNVAMENYAPMLQELSWSIDGLELITIYVFLLMACISAIVCTITIFQIKRSQTGLALRMKPMPRHRLRNIGITIQIIISILFTWVIFLYCSALDSINGNLPDNDDYYKSGLYLRINGIQVNELKQLRERLEDISTIESVVPVMDLVDAYDLGDNNYITLHTKQQRHSEMIDFFNIEIEDQRLVTLPGFKVTMSKAFKERLEQEGLWNGMTFEYKGETYEIDGIYDHIPYESSPYSIILTNQFLPDILEHAFYIMPKTGKTSETRQAVNEAINEIWPSRIDIKCDNLYPILAPKSILNEMLMYLILILAIISMITTVASIYSSVSLDTRRRRKEMALRKVNGATTRIICKLFAKVYITILVVSILITWSMAMIANDFNVISVLPISHPLILYWLAVAMVILITFLTIAWKIRDVMHVDPIEYLKE